MSHVARSLAVPTYHIRPIGETVSCHNAHWWVPLPTVSPGFEPRSTSGLVRPRRSGTARSALYDHPFDQSRRAPAIETCSRCKKATVVAEPTQPPGTSVVPGPTRQPSAVPGSDLWQFFRVVACKAASSDPPPQGHAWIIRQLPQRLSTRQSTGPPPGAVCPIRHKSTQHDCERGAPQWRHLAPAENLADRNHEQLAAATPDVPAAPGTAGGVSCSGRTDPTRSQPSRMPANGRHGILGRCLK